MAVNLKSRVAALEQQVARLEARQKLAGPPDRGWLEDLYGQFANDPVFAKAMTLGRNYRRSLRPGAAKHKSKQ